MPVPGVLCRTSSGWEQVQRSGGRRPTIAESLATTFQVEGEASTLSVAGVPFPIEDGMTVVRPVRSERLSGLIGIVDVAIDGHTVGEIEILPDKISSSQFASLRGALQSLWAGLALDPEAASAVAAQHAWLSPTAVEQWRRIEGAVLSIQERPAYVLAPMAHIGRLEQVRSPRSVTPALIRAHQRGRPGPVMRAGPNHDTPENAMVVDTLRRLRKLAANQPDGAGVHSATSRLLVEEPFRALADRADSRPRLSTRTMDLRYRQVSEVNRVLREGTRTIVEGPGDLRLGVRSLSRLWEYWVFLNILLAAQERYGMPLGDGFAPLATPTSRGTTRLDLLPGTTVRFPGEISIAFEPTVSTTGGWMDLEYVPHPDPDHPASRTTFVTPDVICLRGGTNPAALVYDAKYAARHLVNRKAVEMHGKYSRMKRRGRPLVQFVATVHPHDGFRETWAGYGHLGLAPEAELPTIPLLPPARAVPPPTVAREPAAVAVEPPSPGATARPGGEKVRNPPLGEDAERLAAALLAHVPMRQHHTEQSIANDIIELLPSMCAAQGVRCILLSWLGTTLIAALEAQGLPRSQRGLLVLTRHALVDIGAEIDEHWVHLP